MFLSFKYVEYDFFISGELTPFLGSFRNDESTPINMEAATSGRLRLECEAECLKALLTEQYPTSYGNPYIENLDSKIP